MDTPTQQLSAKDEINNLIASNDFGVKSTFKAVTLNKACSDLFTSQGHNCPVRILEREGTAYIVKRDFRDS